MLKNCYFVPPSPQRNNFGSYWRSEDKCKKENRGKIEEGKNCGQRIEYMYRTMKIENVGNKRMIWGSRNERIWRRESGIKNQRELREQEVIKRGGERGKWG